MKLRSGILRRLADRAVMTGQPVPGVPLVEIIGDRRLLVENHQGVCEYGDEQICVNTRLGKIFVNGSSLELAQMSKEQLVITGSIASITVERGNSQ